MFGFGKKKQGASENLDVLVQYHQASELLEKGKNLAKLGRLSEAETVFVQAENIARKAVKRFPRSLEANVLLALIFSETQQFDKAESLLDSLLNSGIFSFTEEQRITLSSELYKIRREAPASGKSKDIAPEGFTTIYNCQNCGRLINFITMPCHHCLWYPKELADFACSTVLSSTRMNVPSLLFVSRAIAAGRAPSDIVANLQKVGAQFLQMPESQTRLRYMFDLLQKNATKNTRHIDLVRECPGCGARLLLSNLDECKECGEVIDFPDAVRLLICIDNLLWLFEQRAEVSDTSSFSEFVCVLVAIEHEMLRKQEAPSPSRREYALSLLKSMKTIADAKRGAIIETENHDRIRVQLYKDAMDDDSTKFGLFWHTEIVQFVAFMRQGVSV